MCVLLVEACCLHYFTLFSLQLLRTTADQVKQLQDAADQAQAALASTQQHLEDRIAATQAAADKQVAAFKQKWHEEFEKRRKLHNMVIIHTHSCGVCCMSDTRCGEQEQVLI